MIIIAGASLSEQHTDLLICHLVYGRKQTDKQTYIHTHVRNAVMLVWGTLVWGSLRLAPMMHSPQHQSSYLHNFQYKRMMH